jgi:hypothetical protein
MAQAINTLYDYNTNVKAWLTWMIHEMPAAIADMAVFLSEL